jgi:hypothetical protein
VLIIIHTSITVIIVMLIIIVLYSTAILPLKS